MKIQNKRFFGFVVVILFFIFFILYFFIRNSPKNSPKSDLGPALSPTYGKDNIQYIQINENKIKIEIADTKEKREQGLSGRNALKKDEGMLFVFDNPDKYFFWMKDMNFPIDIIWMNESKEIIYIKENASPESYPEVFGGDGYSKYVLEVVSGFVEETKIKIGDKIEFLL